jgi:hypothetical protein
MLLRTSTLALAFLAVSACSRSTAQPATKAASASPAAVRGEPDYRAWQELLAAHYDPSRGMDYAGLKAKDASKLNSLRSQLGNVDASSLTPEQRLAFFINLYNVNVVGIVADRYPVASIRDLSTDPLTRNNIFKKELVPFGGTMISLDEIENERIRKQFKDPRIHFAINCAAVSCPPIRPEPYVGARISEQLDDQVRLFASGPGVTVNTEGGRTILRTTKIMDWFKADFESSGGAAAFLRKYLPPPKAAALSGDVKIEYNDYSWQLNDWKR